MRIVIGGAGKVGSFLVEELSKADHDVFLIETKEHILQDIIDMNDITGIVGNCADYETLVEAEVHRADMFIAVTSSDEINMVSSILAKNLGALHTTVRVRNPIYTNRNGRLNNALGLDLLINPDFESAIHIADLIRNSHALNIESFSNNRVSLIELRIDEGSKLDGMELIDFRQRFGAILVTVIERNGKVIIPEGSTKLQSGDNFFIVGDRAAISEFYKLVGRDEKIIKSVLILGGGHISFHLAKMLASSGKEVTILEVDKKRAQELSEKLPFVRVLQGDGSDQDFLEEARISSYDCMVTLTGIDEENIIASLFGLHRGVQKIITKVNRTNILKLLKNQGIDAVVTPKFLVANRILKKVRSVESSRSSNVDDIYRIANNNAEALMFTINRESKTLGIPLKDLPIRHDVIIACIIRGNEIMYPGGNDAIHCNDQVLIATTSKLFDDIDDILEVKE